LEAWAAVRDRWHVLGHRYDEAYADLRFAEAKLAVGSRREAEAALRRSAAIAEELGAVPLAALVTDIRVRGRLDSMSPAADDGLTAREREILNWVVRGATNRDIADALYISPKTVSVHVSALLRKFGVSGRGDLQSAAGKPASQRGSTADGPVDGVPAPQPVTTVTRVDPSDLV